jgi:hypothetical protein
LLKAWREEQGIAAEFSKPKTADKN